MNFDAESTNDEDLGSDLDELFPRSSQLVEASRSALIIVDMQEKLLPTILHHQRVLRGCEVLLEAAKALTIPILSSVQYPKGLGPLVPSLATQLPNPIEKMAFSCCGAAPFTEQLEELESANIQQIVLAGIETHVCIQQTVMDLLESDFDVFLAVDAVGSRHAFDHDWALQRMFAFGCIPLTVEAVIFEWLGDAEHSQFKAMSALIKRWDSDRCAWSEANKNSTGANGN